ncbi:hypothetical protein DQ397_001057 [Pseudomonas sp. CK-NBRI-02]|uniref:Uncharacterized protein n=1 Tax=Pseudomonas guariconensis TaxID=1288410 RepID=A0AAX0VUH7_9PSED|nr:hypothetical protein CXG49_20715 [Pseudomonas guariconensis]PLV22116.1 hypothetical protein CXG53_21630 [Pseudomonas guariconensis]PLV27236.1 hypothetical protein CXG51_21625 [Pseudomonas guariconensis]TYO83534.1 hypothetical protein DQ397_001057 [Pseudomonas sp. CK-NBRI-02]
MKKISRSGTDSGIVRAGLLADLKIRWCKPSESSFGCTSARRTSPRRSFFNRFRKSPPPKLPG